MPLFHSNPIQHPQLFAFIPAAPETVSPGSCPLAWSFGTPLILGPPQVVVTPSCPLAWSFGSPIIVGGPTTTSLFIGGVDKSKYLLPLGLASQKLGGGGGGGGSAGVGAGPITITSASIGRANATFDLFVNDGYVPRVGQTVVLNDFGRKLFAGCIQAVSCDPVQPNFTNLCFHVSCVDKSSICDSRVVIKTYTAGSDVATTVLDIVTNFLNGEGITTQGVSIAAALGSDVVANFQTVTQTFDAIAAQVGATWWIDMNGVLNFSILSSAPAAPLSLSQVSDNFRNLAATETKIGYANKFYAVSNLKVLPGSGAGVGGAARSETYTFINIGGAAWQQAAFNAGLAPGYVLLQLPISTLVAVTINGSPVAVFPFSGGFQPGHAYYWFDGINTAAVIFPANFVPAIGDVIVVKYIPVYQNATVNTASPLAGTCGSGVIEGVIQVPNIQFQADLDAIAAAYQAKNGSIPFIVTFETDVPGIAVGQAISANLPLVLPGSPTTLYVTNVTLRKADAGVFDLGGNSSFRCSVECSTQQSLGNWLAWFENLILRTQYPLPLNRFETANFVLGPGTSIAGGAQNVNPYIVQNTGQLYAAVGAAGTAPVAQDLLIDILVNGASVFGGDITKMLKIPAGSTALQTVSVFKSPGLFVFKGDLITVTTQYSVLGPNPVAAQSVSGNLQWTY